MPGIKSKAANTLVNSVPRWSRRAHRALATVLPGRRSIDFYWSAACPYSYVMSQQLQRLTAGSDIDVRVYPVPLGAPDVDPSPALRRSHGPRDCASLANFYDIDFPEEWTVPSEADAMRASQIAIMSQSLGASLDLGHALWRGDHEALANAADRFGEAQPATTDDILAKNAARQRKHGHYHPGSIRYLGEWFEGPMRTELLAERLTADGYTPEPPWSRQFQQSTASTTASAGFEMWFSFRSPYSYVAIAQLQQWRDRGEEFAITFRPVLPMVMRGLPVPKAKKMHLVTDAAREAHRLGIPFGLIADPVGAGAERCLAVCAAVSNDDDHTQRAFDFAVAASAGIWSEGIDVATDEGLVALASRSGIARDEVRAAISNIPAGLALAETNRSLLLEAGVWGVPSFRSGDFVTWGQDRLHLIRTQIGLAELQ